MAIEVDANFYEDRNYKMKLDGDLHSEYEEMTEEPRDIELSDEQDSDEDTDTEPRKLRTKQVKFASSALVPAQPPEYMDDEFGLSGPSDREFDDDDDDDNHAEVCLKYHTVFS
ncbi:unnamed protein product [Echinostoma caproni]|uniref:SPT6_acidic domain-containing protein n=1 Tax=Echinostoma caproni TaxID=27848 RepID=A0A183A069_9TREM|nr:unnamed protein product [Echinostoma caproni]